MEPLAVAVHCFSLANFHARKVEKIAVFGAGPIGLLCMAVARALGTARIFAIDINKDRLEFAKQYAAMDIYVPPSLPLGKQAEAEIVSSKLEYSKNVAMEMLGGDADGTGKRLAYKGFDIVIEATGAETCMQTGMYITKPGGTFIQVR